MPLIRSPDKGVVSDIELFPKDAEISYHEVSMVLGSPPFFCRSLFDLLSVLICSCQEKNLAPGQSVSAGENISSNRCIGMPDMGDVVYIVYWCCYVVALIHFS